VFCTKAGRDALVTFVTDGSRRRRVLAAYPRSIDPHVEPARRLPPVLFWTYEAAMAALALAVVALLGLADEGWVRTANLSIWAAFVVDYGVRVALSEDRRVFVRHNIPDLIAILPLDFLRIARLARLSRLVRLVRAGTILWRVTRNARGVLSTNGLGWVLAVALTAVLVGSLAVWSAEPRFGNFGDALWWSIVTATTVGYGDLSPSTTAGRAIAAVLMLIGIGTLGMLTAAIATFFIAGHRGKQNEQVEWVREQLERWDELEPAERRRLAAMLQGLAATDDSGSLHRP
jgi:voltage-gated potassium channel